MVFSILSKCKKSIEVLGISSSIGIEYWILLDEYWFIPWQRAHASTPIWSCPEQSNSGHASNKIEKIKVVLKASKSVCLLKLALVSTQKLKLCGIYAKNAFFLQNCSIFGTPL